MQDLSARRRFDGSIDIYRQRGPMERGIVMTHFFRGLGKVCRPLVAIAVLAATVYMAPRDGAAYRSPTARMTAPTGTSLVYPPTTAQLYAAIPAR